MLIDEKGSGNLLIKYEIKKIMKNPVVWILMLFFLTINILNIETQISEYKKDMKLTHQYILDNKIDKEYLNSVVSIYDDFNMQIVKNTKMDLYDYNPSGKYKLFIDNCYKKLEKRVEEIKKEEHRKIHTEKI